MDQRRRPARHHNPRDRSSAFADSTWLNAGRATPLDQPFVEPGRDGRFTFTVRGANRRAVRPGGRVVFRGRLKGGHVPRRGVLVVLQGEQRGFGWRTFKTVRARRGRFAGVYRFVRAPSGTTFRFRAVVREQPTYPWATGRSRPVTVRLR